MGAFPGFGISGYRSLTGEVQWIPLDGGITVFLGGNNSGKSNVLRILHLHMARIFDALSKGQEVGGFDQRRDASRGSADAGLRVVWPIDVDAIGAWPQYPQVEQDLERVLQLPELNRFEITGLLFESSELNGSTLEISLPMARTIMESTVGRQINWGHISNTLTGSSGGEQGTDTQRVLLRIRETCIAPPMTEYVPPSRSLSSGPSTDQWNFSGEGMVHQLRRLKNPDFDEDALRERADSLTADLRTLLEDDSLEFAVPQSQDTVNFRLRGLWFPLDSLGTGTEHAVVILAARHVFPDRLLCLEEPDAHLHPRLQRRLVALLRRDDGGASQVAIATHSAHMIDAADTIVAVRLDGVRSSVVAVGDHALFEALRSLGYRASDILQTNCIVWVEGPSDRIYLLRWLEAAAPDLVEGVDFSVVFYGGALLARLSAKSEGLNDPTLVDLWSINRRMWLLMDSDSGEGDLKPAVERLQGEVANSGTGGTWISSGYTIENYVDPDVLEKAVCATHPSVARIADKSAGVDPLANLERPDGTRFTGVDKVAVALTVVAEDADLSVLDLSQRIRELAEFIRESSREMAVAPVNPDAPPEPAE